MQTIIGQMLEQYRDNSLGEERNALKEVVQEVALCGRRVFPLAEPKYDVGKFFYRTKIHTS